MEEVFERLTKPFQPREHDINYTGYAYISEMAITTRLDDVVGAFNWQWRTVDLQQSTSTHWVATVELSILSDNGWITRAGVGEGTASINNPYKDGKDPLDDPRYVSNMGENAAKSAETDAFRRAARHFGIGRYLLDAPKFGQKNFKGLENWLLANYAKPTASKPQQQQPKQPKRQPVENKRMDELETIARAIDMKLIHKIEPDPNSRALRNPRYIGWCNYQDGEDTKLIKITLYSEHVKEIITKLGLKDWKSKTARNLDYPPYTFKTPVGILTCWDKGRYVKYFEMVLTDENPAIQAKKKPTSRESDIWTRIYTDEKLLEVYNGKQHISNAINKYPGQPLKDGFDKVKAFLLDRKVDMNAIPA